MLATVIPVVAVGSATPNPRPNYFFFFSLHFNWNKDTNQFKKNKGEGSLHVSVLPFGYMFVCCHVLWVSALIYLPQRAAVPKRYFSSAGVVLSGMQQKIKLALELLEVVLFQISLMLFFQSNSPRKAVWAFAEGNLLQIWSLKIKTLKSNSVSSNT